MGYNRSLVTGTRSTRDSLKKQQYRQTKFDSAPRIELRHLADGAYRIRFWPEDPKNPHGYLDNRVHKVPQGMLVEGVDPRFVKMQCPRSSNWDPSVFDPQTGEERYTERCACCELDEWVFNTPYDPEYPDGTYVIDGLPEHLQEIIGKIDYRANGWDSGLFIPCTINAVVDTRTKGEDGFETVTYKMGGTEDMMSAVLKIWHPDFSDRLDENGVAHPKNGIPEQLIRFFEQCPDANDLQFGRWITLTKTNGGSGANGYSFMPDPYASPFNKELVDYGKIYDFTKWGDKTRKKPSIRLPYHQQVAILCGADWAHELRSYDVPLTDSDVDLLENGHNLVDQGYVPSHQQQPPMTQQAPNYQQPQLGGNLPPNYQQTSVVGIPVTAPPSNPGYASTPYAPPSTNPIMGSPMLQTQTNQFGQSFQETTSPFNTGGVAPTQYGGFPG